MSTVTTPAIIRINGLELTFTGSTPSNDILFYHLVNNTYTGIATPTVASFAAGDAVENQPGVFTVTLTGVLDPDSGAPATDLSKFFPIRLKAQDNDYLYSGLSTPFSGNTPPTTPSNLVVTGRTLTFTRSTAGSNPITGYAIYDASSDGTLLYNDIPPAGGIDLNFIQSSGTYWLETATGYETSDRVSFAVTVSPPTPPSNLVVTGRTLTFTASEARFHDIIGYNVYTASSGGSLVGNTADGPSPAGINLFALNVVLLGTYWLEAYTSFNLYSSRVSFTVTSFPPPNAPSNLVVTGNTLTFTPATPGYFDIAGYYFYAASSGGSPISNIFAPVQGGVDLPSRGIVLPGTYWLEAYTDYNTASTRVSFTVGQGGGGGGGGGGGAGDPYITTIDGVHYKLPMIDAPVRYYQGRVNGKLLTVNVALRNTDNDAMLTTNLVNYQRLKNKMSPKASALMLQKIATSETLNFMEKVYVSYGDSHVLMDIWSQKIKVLSKGGDEIVGKAGDDAVIDAYTREYKEYKHQTLTLVCGSARVHIAVYGSAIVRNGVAVEAPSMSLGNGVIVNTLSQKDMILADISSVETVPRRDAPLKVKKEIFVDAKGTRTRTILHA